MYLAGALVFFVALLIVSIQNPNTVELRFITWKAELPLVVVIMGSAFFGAAITGLIALVGRIRQAIQIRDLQRQVRQLEDEFPGGKPAGPPAVGNGLG